MNSCGQEGDSLDSFSVWLIKLNGFSAPVGKSPCSSVYNKAELKDLVAFSGVVADCSHLASPSTLKNPI